MKATRQRASAFTLAALLGCAGLLAPALAADPAGNPSAQSGNSADQSSAPASGTGIDFSAVIVSVAQRVNNAGARDQHGHARINYRADVNLSIAAGSWGPLQGTAATQLRAGYGRGVKLVPTYNGSANATAFTSADGEKGDGTVAQAYYELEWHLGGPRAMRGTTPNRLVLTTGKLDFFGLFDQNTVSGDESVQFLNNAFVHHPLLDAGGDIAADRHGFQPGARLGYFATEGATEWGASVGVFASGPAANFSEAPRRPLVIAQLEASPRQARDRPRDNYRLYVWTNGRATDPLGNEQRHTGIGISADQRLGRDLSLFQRLGRRTSGHGAFDDAIAVGLEYGGSGWGRASDGAGLAFGWLRTSTAYRDFTADGSAAGYRASGAERIAELYYRVSVNKWLQVTPDLQFIQRPGGNGDAATARVIGLRARIAF